LWVRWPRWPSLIATVESSDMEVVAEFGVPLVVSVNASSLERARLTGYRKVYQDWKEEVGG